MKWYERIGTCGHCGKQVEMGKLNSFYGVLTCIQCWKENKHVEYGKKLNLKRGQGIWTL